MSRLHLDVRGAGLAFDCAGNRLGSVLLDGADGDVFWAGGGNDRIFGNGDRDCAVWGAENCAGTRSQPRRGPWRWSSATSPTLAQAKAARQDVWRAAGLATT